MFCAIIATLTVTVKTNMVLAVESSRLHENTVRVFPFTRSRVNYIPGDVTVKREIYIIYDIVACSRMNERNGKDLLRLYTLYSYQIVLYQYSMNLLIHLSTCLCFLVLFTDNFFHFVGRNSLHVRVLPTCEGRDRR